LKCHNQETYSDNYKDNEPQDKPGCENISGDQCNYKFDESVFGKHKLSSFDPEFFFTVIAEKMYFFLVIKNRNQNIIC